MLYNNTRKKTKKRKNKQTEPKITENTRYTAATVGATTINMNSIDRPLIGVVLCYPIGRLPSNTSFRQPCPTPGEERNKVRVVSFRPIPLRSSLGQTLNIGHPRCMPVEP